MRDQNAEGRSEGDVAQPANYDVLPAVRADKGLGLGVRS